MNNPSKSLWARVSVLLTGAILAAWPALAGDLAKGYTFAPNEKNVDQNKLNHLVDQAVINTTFFTDKSATTTPQAADIFLIYSAASGTFKKCSLDSLLFSNPNVISTQPEDSAPATNDYILTYSTAGSALRKATLENAFFNNSGLINLQPRSTNALPGNGLLLGSSNGVYYAYGLSNVLSEWWRWMRFSTNIAPSTNYLFSLHTHPTNLDGLLIWDSQHATNKVATLIGIVTNLPTVATNGVTNTDMVQIISTATNVNNPYGTNNTVSQIAVPNLLGWRKLVWQIPVPVAAGSNGIAHGLPGTPQVLSRVLVCTTAELGYSIGDEVNPFLGIAGSGPVLSANSTNIVLSGANTSYALPTKGTGAGSTAITKANWNEKITAYYYPW